MSQSDDAIIYWGQNVTLRRFLIVSSVMLSWIACDLALQMLSSANMSGHGGWKMALSATGIDWRKVLFDDWQLDTWRLHIYTAYSLPAVGLLVLVLLDRLASQGETSLPRMVSWCGAAFIIGGAIFDIATTVAYSPDLAMEGNPYVRVLLDSRHSLAFVYVHALVTQSLYITLFCGLWFGFLRHRETIAATISAAAPVTWFDFLKAATGGAHLTTRQWLFPLKPSEVPLLYHYVWLIAIPVVFGISLFRWYAALEWLGVVEPALVSRVLVVLHGVFSTLLLYLVAMWRMSRPLVRA
ncbi:MAG: hypothetical protein AABP62_11880 [Planctomycetota bacterium]